MTLYALVQFIDYVGWFVMFMLGRDLGRAILAARAAAPFDRFDA